MDVLGIVIYYIYDKFFNSAFLSRALVHAAGTTSLDHAIDGPVHADVRKVA